MRKALIILLTLITLFAQAQTNPDANRFAYTSLSDAVTTATMENQKIMVSENGAQASFVVRSRARGYIPDGGTIIAMADSVNVLVREISQSRGVKLNWFLKNDGVTDNAAKMNWLVSAASPFNHFIIEKGDNFFCSQNIAVQKAILIEGPDGCEAVNTAYFSFPQAVNGFTFNNANSAGSVLRGFAITSTIPESGRILEYNPNNATMLYIAPVTTITAGKTFEFKDSYFPDKVKGTAVISNAGTANIAYAITYTKPTGTFAIGDTVKGATSGAKALVRFVSRYYNALAVATVSGTFKVNETLTGTASGATAKFVSIPVPNRWQFAKVASITNVTGALDNTSDSTLTDSTNFATSGTLDSVGASGKRTNIFCEARKYSIGVTVNRRIEMEDLTVYGFGSDEVLITNITTPVSNANLTRVNRCRFNAGAGSGVRINGGDANHISITNSTMVNNAGWGICDISFLGITASGNHVSVNMVGGYTSGTYINRKSLADNPYTEGAYSGMLPWQTAENIYGGGTVKIGGTDGLPNNVPYWSTSGNSGAAFEINEIHNNLMYTTPGTVSKAIVFKGTGVNPVPLWAEAQGLPGNGRGAGIGFRTPFGAGFQRVDVRSAAMDMGYILGLQTATGYGYQFFMRKSIPPTISITTSNGRGKGAVLQADIKNGKLTAINVLAGGQSYPINGTTISVPNASNTTLNPIIEDSVIVGVQVLGDSLTTNPDNDIAPVWQLGSDTSFTPLTTATGSLGTSSKHIRIAYIDNIVTNTAGASIPTRLVAQDLGGATALEMLSLKATGNSAIGRGTLAGFTTPGGAGIATEIVTVGGIWGANSHGTFVVNVGDDSASISEKMRVNSLGQLGLGTTTPDASAILHINSTTQGTLLPRMTSAQINAISSPANGLLVYNREKNVFRYRDSITAKWRNIVSSDTLNNLSVGGSLTIGSVATGTFGGMDVLMYDADNSVKRISSANFLNANHPTTTGGAPSVAGGTNVSASVSKGRDAAFQLTLVVTGSGASGTLATVTYNTSWGATAPTVVFSQANALAAGVINLVYADATSGSTLVVSSSGTLAAGTYLFNFNSVQ
jgi:hypothetical protein